MADEGEGVNGGARPFPRRRHGKTTNLLELAAAALAAAIIASRPIRELAQMTEQDLEEDEDRDSDEGNGAAPTHTPVRATLPHQDSATSLPPPVSPPRAFTVKSPSLSDLRRRSSRRKQRRVDEGDEADGSHDDDDDDNEEAIKAWLKSGGGGTDEGGKNARTKRDGTIVTDADGAAQGIIVAAIRRVSSDVKIVGEESLREMAMTRSQRYATDSARAYEEDEETSRIFELARSTIRANAAAVGLLSDDQPAPENGEGEAEVADEGEGEEPPAVDEIDEPPEENEIDEPLAEDEIDEPPAEDEVDEPPEGEDTRDAEPHPQELEPAEQDDQEEPTDAAPVHVETSRVTIFIDPLDGTKAYANGEYDSVTTLVAIIMDNTPIFGVVCKPFGQDGVPSLTENDECYAVYGGMLLRGAYVAGGIECERSRTFHHGSIDRRRQSYHLENGLREEAPEAAVETPSELPTYDEQETHELLKAVISRSRSPGIVQDFIGALSSKGLIHPQPLYISGAGEKTLRLIAGHENEGLWFFPKPGTSLWDVAVADALLRVVGGRLSDKDGNVMDYSKSRSNAENLLGVVACNNVRLHQECIKAFRRGSWAATKDE